MSVLLTIIAVAVIFSALVLIHEAGHFFAARKAGVRVMEFGLGFPPRLFKKKIGDTTYTINAVPFGGFVKLYGEDATNQDILKAKDSFAHQTPWVRTKIVVAGVVMNFVLAIVLLTIGFTFGIEPLILNEDDLYANLEQGTVDIAPGAFVGKVSDEVGALGVAVGDQILAVNDQPLQTAAQLGIFAKGAATNDVDLTVRTSTTKELKRVHIPLTNAKGSLGIDLKAYTDFPRLRIQQVKPASNSARAGVRAGDIILQINGLEIYDETALAQVLASSSEVNMTLLRGSDIFTVKVTLPESQRVVVADVFAGSPAAKMGILDGDLIIAINNAPMRSPADVQAAISALKGESAVYLIDRGGVSLRLVGGAGQEKRLGVAISQIAAYRNNELSVYRDALLTSITHINKVKYGLWTAFKTSLSESMRLTGLTVSAFTKTFSSIFLHFNVPADVGGPVQIAVYTHTFIKEGFFAVLRFMALLSLSLAVINVLPIPALDGGRLLFILIEVVTGRRVSAQIESRVHMIGFAFLMLLIVLVTYSDITKLF